MNYENLIVEIEDSVATITLNRPEQRNALSGALRAEFKDFVENRLDGVNAVVVTGAGPAFCAGMDLKEPVGHNEGKEQWSFFKLLFNTNTIFIAALNGPVRGAGLTLVSACDMAIADPSVNFALPQITHGIYGGVAAAMLHLSLPKKVVMEMTITGLPISAERAREVGLINTIAEPGEYLNMAKALAKRIAGFKPEVLGIAKHMAQSVPVDDAGRELALKEARLATLLSRPLQEDKVIDTEYGGNS